MWPAGVGFMKHSKFHEAWYMIINMRRCCFTTESELNRESKDFGSHLVLPQTHCVIVGKPHPKCYDSKIKLEKHVNAERSLWPGSPPHLCSGYLTSRRRRLGGQAHRVLCLPSRACLESVSLSDGTERECSWLWTKNIILNPGRWDWAEDWLLSSKRIRTL